MICRTKFADDIQSTYHKKNGGSSSKWILLIIITFLFATFSCGFYLMSDSMSIIYPLLFAAAFIASFAALIHSLLNANNEFRAFVLTRDEVIMVDCAKAFLDSRSFGEDFNNPFEREYIKRIRAQKKLGEMNSASKYEDYILSPFVMQNYGYFFQKVEKIKLGEKYITVHARLRAASYPPDAKLIFNPVRRLKIPADFTNISNLTERLESFMNN